MPSSRSRKKVVLTQLSNIHQQQLQRCLQQLTIDPKRAKALFRLLCARKGNTRKVVYEFHLGRGFVHFGCTSEKSFVSQCLPVNTRYYDYLQLARIEVVINPYGRVGQIREALLLAIQGIGALDEGHYAMYRECWTLALKEVSYRLDRVEVKHIEDSIQQMHQSHSNSR